MREVGGRGVREGGRGEGGGRGKREGLWREGRGSGSRFVIAVNLTAVLSEVLMLLAKLGKARVVPSPVL